MNKDYYLSPFTELNDYPVEVADGHFMGHACHTKKSNNGVAYSAGFIFALNLRNGLVNPLCMVINGIPENSQAPLADSLSIRNIANAA